MAIQSINPTTEEVEAEFEDLSASEMEDALDQSEHASHDWSRTSFDHRASLVRAAGDYLRQHRDRFASLITAEMGKPISESEAEIDKCAWNCEYYAENGERFLAPEHRESSATESYVEFTPLGTVLAVMPWNFPFWQVFRFAAPALMAGNVALLKHASNVPRCALAIEEVFRESGLPMGAFRTLMIGSGAVKKVIEDRRVQAVTLTGSDVTGSTVASAAGRALKKTVLELGGSDPFVVLSDADIELAATTAARARFLNAGQSCIAAKRFIVLEEIADEFTSRFKDAVEGLRVGDPRYHETQVGPLARADLRDSLEDQVMRSVAMGARIKMGGARLERKGYFLAPTIVTGVTTEMPLFREETFGPVAAVIRAKKEDEAIALANDSQYGLGASVWTRDIERARSIAPQIESGSVFINGMVASDPRLPFGGVKRSGYGRELSSFGIREFVNAQTVWIGPAKNDGAASKPERLSATPE